MDGIAINQHPTTTLLDMTGKIVAKGKAGTCVEGTTMEIGGGEARSSMLASEESFLSEPRRRGIHGRHPPPPRATRRQERRSERPAVGSVRALEKLPLEKQRCTMRQGGVGGEPGPLRPALPEGRSRRPSRPSTRPPPAGTLASATAPVYRMYECARGGGGGASGSSSRLTCAAGEMGIVKTLQVIAAAAHNAAPDRRRRRRRQGQGGGRIAPQRRLRRSGGGEIKVRQRPVCSNRCWWRAAYRSVTSGVGAGFIDQPGEHGRQGERRRRRTPPGGTRGCRTATGGVDLVVTAAAAPAEKYKAFAHEEDDDDASASADARGRTHRHVDSERDGGEFFAVMDFACGARMHRRRLRVLAGVQTPVEASRDKHATAEEKRIVAAHRGSDG